MPPARAPLLPTPRLCKSSRPPALSVRLPWHAVLLSAPSKHCARRRLLAHTPKAAGPAGWLPAPSSLSPERPCWESFAAQQKVSPLRWPGIEPGSTAWKAAMLTTIPPTLHSPGGLRTPAPGSPQHTLPAAAAAAASASLPRRPVSRRLCAAAGATSSRAPPHARQRDAVAWSTGPTALRPSGPSLPAAARERLRPQPRRATRGTQLPAPSWPKKPFSTGRWAPPLPTTTWGHGTQLPARVAALCRAARRGRREPRSPLRQPVGVGAWACPNFRSGRARLGSPRRRQFRHGDSAPSDHKGLRLEGCTGKGFDGG